MPYRGRVDIKCYKGSIGGACRWLNIDQEKKCDDYV